MELSKSTKVCNFLSCSVLVSVELWLHVSVVQGRLLFFPYQIERTFKLGGRCKPEEEGQQLEQLQNTRPTHFP